MMKKRLLFSVLLLLTFSLLLSSCGGSDVNGADRYPEKGDITGEYGDSASMSTSDVISSERKIIKTVYETVETETYDQTVEALKTAVAEAGGYFSSSSYTGAGVETTRARTADFEIRIPAEKLSDFTGKLGTLATVVSYKETANDVTLSYIDIESRIAVLEAEETALLSILTRADTTSEMLEIRKSLSDTQSSLASLRAQKESYDSLVSYSTVHLELREVLHARQSDGSFFSEVGDDFMQSLSAIGSFFRGIGVFLLGSSPILLLIAVVFVCAFFLGRHIYRRRRAKNASTSAPFNSDTE